MRPCIWAIFLLLVLPLHAAAGEGMYLYLECGPGEECIHLPDLDNIMMPVQTTPSMVLTKSDFESARIDTYDESRQSVGFVFKKDAAEKFGKLTEANIGKRLMVVFNDKILTAPVIREAIRGGEIRVDGKEVSFWREISWVRELIEESYGTNRRMIIAFVIIAAAVICSALAFILLPRMRRTYP